MAWISWQLAALPARSSLIFVNLSLDDPIHPLTKARQFGPVAEIGMARSACGMGPDRCTHHVTQAATHVQQMQDVTRIIATEIVIREWERLFGT